MSVTAKNAVTKRATRSERRDYRKGIILIYSGINVPILWSEALRHRYQTHQWLTYKQALDSGAQVRKGEKSITVVFASQVTVKRRKKKSAAACCEHITCSMLMRTRLHDSSANGFYVVGRHIIPIIVFEMSPQIIHDGSNLIVAHHRSERWHSALSVDDNTDWIAAGFEISVSRKGRICSRTCRTLTVGHVAPPANTGKQLLATLLGEYETFA
jgi:hypothetical protein